MKHLNANLDNTTNIEVPLQSSTRILGLDADNNVIEITPGTISTDGDGAGDMSGGDLTDMGGGGSGSGADILIGNTFCFDLPVFRTEINPCYQVGNILQVNDSTTTPSSVITSEITSIDEVVTPGMTITYTGTTDGDANGFTAGSNEWYKPFRDHYIWEVVSETAINNSISGWGFIDYAWEFPNGAGQFWFPNTSTLTGYVPNDGSDISGITEGTLLYGRFAGTLASEAGTWNAIEVGGTVTLSHHGSITLRKVGVLTERPDPQLWVSTGGFSCYCIYPPFSSNFNSTGFFYGNTGSIRNGSGGSHVGIGQWFPTIKADGTTNNVASALGLTFTNVNSLGSGSQIRTEHGFPTQHGPFGLRFTGGTFTHNGTIWNNDNAGSATTVFNDAATSYLGDTIVDPNRANFFGGVPTSGDYIPPGATLTLGSFEPTGGSGPAGGGSTPDTAVTTICAEITAVDSSADPNFPVSTTMYDFNPLCGTSGGGGDDDTSDGDGGVDTRVCADKKIGVTEGILLYTSGTTELAAGVDLSTNPTLSTVELDITGLGEQLGTLTTSTTFEDVEDGSLEVTVGEASLTVGYSSARINGDVITLAGDVTTLEDQPVTFNIFNSSFPHPDSIAVASIVGEINTTTEFTLTSGTIAGGTGPFFVTELILFGNAISAVRVATTPGGTPLSGVVTTAGSASGTTDVTTFGNLTVTEGAGEWFAPGTAQVCLNGSGGDGNFGGDLGVGGDATFNGNVKIPTLTDNTIPVKADNDCLVDSAITSVASTAGAAESGTDGELRQYLGGGVTLPLTVALTAGDTLADLATLGNTLFSGAGAEGDQITFAEVVQLFQDQVQQASFTGTGYFRLGTTFADNDGVILFDIDPATTGDPTGWEQADFVVRDTVSFEWNPAVGSMYGGGIDYVPAQAGIAASATVTGDLTVTGDIFGNIHNINTEAPVSHFQIWAGTQDQFDSQYGTFNMAGLMVPGGGFIDNAGTASSQGPAVTDGSVVYIIT